MNIFFDGYNIKADKLDSESKILDFLNMLNIIVFNNKGEITIVPYFNGKVKKMGGISATILGNNFHFTCHTFCFLNTVFIDYYGNDNNKQEIIKIILDYFDTNDYDLCEENYNIKGNFGKQIIITYDDKCLEFEYAKYLINKIIKSIEMTPIYTLLTNYKDEENYDLIQLIAESHISIHKKNEHVGIDVFSCKNFNENNIFELLENDKYNIKIINRGLYFNID